VLQADAFDAALLPTLREHGPYDLVLSDMAPSTTGHRSTDKIRSFELFSRAVAIATELGAEGSSFVGKLFMSGQLDEARTLLRERYTKVRILRPEAVREVSYEVFLAGLEARPQSHTTSTKPDSPMR
jgi:23S rRNA (uridine2552-2'-O)-methyltransferase